MRKRKQRKLCLGIKVYAAHISTVNQNKIIICLSMQLWLSTLRRPNSWSVWRMHHRCEMTELCGSWVTPGLLRCGKDKTSALNQERGSLQWSRILWCPRTEKHLSKLLLISPLLLRIRLSRVYSRSSAVLRRDSPVGSKRNTGRNLKHRRKRKRNQARKRWINQAQNRRNRNLFVCKSLLISGWTLRNQ